VTIWYAIRVRPQKEFDAANDIRATGHDVFLPVEVVRTKSRHKAKPVDVRRPLVRGYIFASSPWHDHKHVYGPVMMSGNPIRITDAAMVPLYHATGRLVDNTPKMKSFSIGEVLRVAIGPFAGQEITVGRIIKGQIETVVRLFGREMTVRVPKGQIAA
jgi:transcription antitermination factor NusG